MVKTLVKQKIKPKTVKFINEDTPALISSAFHIGTTTQDEFILTFYWVPPENEKILKILTRFAFNTKQFEELAKTIMEHVEKRRKIESKNR